MGCHQTNISFKLREFVKEKQKKFPFLLFIRPKGKRQADVNHQRSSLPPDNSPGLSPSFNYVILIACVWVVCWLLALAAPTAVRLQS